LREKLLLQAEKVSFDARKKLDTLHEKIFLCQQNNYFFRNKTFPKFVSKLCEASVRKYFFFKEKLCENIIEAPPKTFRRVNKKKFSAKAFANVSSKLFKRSGECENFSASRLQKNISVNWPRSVNKCCWATKF
jgi:hypothetical protein